MLRRVTINALVLSSCAAALRTPSAATALRARPLAMAASSSFRNPNNLPTKVCVVCNRPFTWRKKWERDWDEITTCSKRCNSERKKSNRIAAGAERAEGESGSSGGSDAESSSPSIQSEELDAKQERKARKKAAKAATRARREGNDAGGQKACSLCERSVDLLIRCQTDCTKEWKMVCGKCWKTPAVAGGVVDGDGGNAFYRYGGIWKNLHKAAA